METVVTGAFDNLRSHDLRFLQEASRLGDLTVLLWNDELVRVATRQPPKFPMAERLYILKAVRYVARVVPAGTWTEPGGLPLAQDFRGALWVDLEGDLTAQRRRFCERHGLEYRVLAAGAMGGFPEPPPPASASDRKRVVATGCYDWLHSGHVRFFEEVSAHGDLYVVVGHDANIRLLKGAGHPLLCDAERRFLVGSIRYVAQALISSGHGWLDAEPEIRRIQPHIYAVNEDGDRGGKRDYCARHGIEYLVLKREPAAGLPKRSSTDLRGF